MKKTFMTTMPDQAGAFLKADRCLAGLGLNITRVSYNKAVDAHMLFIEAEGSEESLRLAQRELSKLGYLTEQHRGSGVILFEFKLKNEAGALYPVTKLVEDFGFNISYMSYTQSEGEYQRFKMGIFIEDPAALSDFMHRASEICPVKVLNYDKSEKVLDNTVFYLSFANEISEKMGFDERAKNRLVVNANRIMQILDEQGNPPYKTFDYIGKFADCIHKGAGEGYVPRVSRLQTAGGIPVLLIEPPCGSNTTVLFLPDRLLVCDGGFPCYEEELLAVLRREIPDFDTCKKEIFLSHGDVDHVGLCDIFDKVHLSANCLENFRRERDGEGAFREENPLHAPYVKISKLLAHYKTPEAKCFCPIGEKSKPTEALRFAGEMKVGELTFKVYDGMGGHVLGEAIYVEPTHRIAFTGDVLVNLKNFTAEQARFNRLAPYLMTSVDTDPAAAKAEREALMSILTPGLWQIFPGHGGVMTVEVDEK
ncbi:MAG: MBL fold metallo-hydrolase [Ruminococcaceae bacterium]|nr:MBL fold metallo-hydrolase [Oscillospiraceae bacterium]